MEHISTVYDDRLGMFKLKLCSLPLCWLDGLFIIFFALWHRLWCGKVSTILGSCKSNQITMNGLPWMPFISMLII